MKKNVNEVMKAWQCSKLQVWLELLASGPGREFKVTMLGCKSSCNNKTTEEY